MNPGHEQYLRLRKMNAQFPETQEDRGQFRFLIQAERQTGRI